MTLPARPLKDLLGRGGIARRYDHLLTAVDAAVFFVAPRTGLVRDVNAQAIALTGLARADLLALSLSELIDASRPEGEQALEVIRTMHGRGEQLLPDVPLLGFQRRRKPADLRISYAGQEDNDALVLILAYDAESRLQRERRAAENQHALDHLGKLAALVANFDPFTAPADSLQTALRHAREALLANAVGLYQVAILPERAFTLLAHTDLDDLPPTLSASAAHTLRQPVTWQASSSSFALPPELQQAAARAGYTALHTAPLRSGPQAMVGLLVVGYQHFIPATAREMLHLTAQLINALLTTTLQAQQTQNDRRHTEELSVLFDSILNGLGDAVLVADGQWQVLRINPALTQLLGYTPQDALGRQVSDLLIGGGLQLSTIVETLAQGQPVQQQQALLYHRDGSERAVWLSADRLPAPAEGAFFVLSDRTTQRALEEESHTLRQRAFVGELSAVFAHELRNPLNGIATSVQFLNMQLAPESPLHEVITDIENEISRIDRLVKGILPLARADRDLISLPMGPLLTGILNRWQPRLQRYQIQADCHELPGTPPALADLRQMEQVFTNLITNAIDAMQATGGDLQIQVGPCQQPQGRFVEIRVADTGPGIPEDRLAQVFKSFYTTKAQGTGLGLPIAQQIIAGHRGNITVESWLGAGTVFTVRIPAAPEETP